VLQTAVMPFSFGKTADSASDDSAFAYAVYTATLEQEQQLQIYGDFRELASHCSVVIIGQCFH
jgi:hypothetical protein